jgi:hypothetical protein
MVCYATGTFQNGMLQNLIALQNGTVTKKVRSLKTVHVIKIVCYKTVQLQNSMLQNGTQTLWSTLWHIA